MNSNLNVGLDPIVFEHSTEEIMGGQPKSNFEVAAKNGYLSSILGGECCIPTWDLPQADKLLRQESHPHQLMDLLLLDDGWLPRFFVRRHLFLATSGSGGRFLLLVVTR